MRSFENRNDTEVYDEPFYAYYLSKTKLNHPMKEEIIKHYPVSQNKIINKITSETGKNKIFFKGVNFTPVLRLGKKTILRNYDFVEIFIIL